MLFTSSFVDDITFSHNKGNRQENYTLLMAYVCRFQSILLQLFVASLMQALSRGNIQLEFV